MTIKVPKSVLTLAVCVLILGAILMTLRFISKVESQTKEAEKLIGQVISIQPAGLEDIRIDLKIVSVGKVATAGFVVATVTPYIAKDPQTFVEITTNEWDGSAKISLDGNGFHFEIPKEIKYDGWTIHLIYNRNYKIK